ncbi:MAG: type II toxin-antitoxin system HicB family antitoxin, partial [Chloroflexota bacterium]
MVKTYIFMVEVEQDEDGRWGAEIPALPGCATWGYTKAEALEALQDGAQAYLEVMMEHNDPLPQEA